MKAVKVMLSAVMLMLVAVVLAIADIGRGSWLSGAALLLVAAAVVVFVIGLFMKR